MKNNMFKKLILIVTLAIGLFSLSNCNFPIKDLYKSTVMIRNREKTAGGTGVIYRSYNNVSFILTNGHVCELVKKYEGGVVTTENNADYYVSSYVQSELHDLCLIQVTTNLFVNTNVSLDAPKKYDKAYIFGHPHLLPTVITEGYFSNKVIIDVTIGTKPCTEKDVTDLNSALTCFFGGLPIIKAFEAILVSATIMPGSSGSAVFNDKGEISALVFSGESDFGYAFAVPVEYIHRFLEVELKGKIK